jgi:hypothetical protein
MKNNSKKRMLYDIFMSYCHADREIVHRIADELKRLNYKIWIDRDMTEGNWLYPCIQNGIDNSHLIICFVSEKYCNSDNCVREITYSVEERKIILPITLDKYFKRRECEIKMLLSPIFKFYAHKQPNTFSPWSDGHFEKLKTAVFEISKTSSSITMSRFERIKYYSIKFISFAKKFITYVVIAIYVIAIILIIFI